MTLCELTSQSGDQKLTREVLECPEIRHTVIY